MWNISENCIKRSESTFQVSAKHPKTFIFNSLHEHMMRLTVILQLEPPPTKTKPNKNVELPHY